MRCRYDDDDDDDDGSLPEGRFIGYYATWGWDMSVVVSHCLPHRELWVTTLSKVATHWLEIGIRTGDPPVTRHRTYHYTTASNQNNLSPQCYTNLSMRSEE